jgi:hypothetical protein
MRNLRRTHGESGANAPQPVKTRPLRPADLTDLDEQLASNPPDAKALPRITLSLPAVDPDDLSSNSLHLRDSFARLPAVRKQDLARLPRTTLRLPALRPESADQDVLELPPPAEQAVIFISGADEGSLTRLARWKTPTRVRFLFRLALLPLVFALLLGGQSFAAHLTQDCSPALVSQQKLPCLAFGLFSPFSDALLHTSRQPPQAMGHAPAGPRMPAVPINLPANVYNFIKLALPYAFQAHLDLGWQTSVIVAQWGLENGWYEPSATGYNWGNVRSVPGAPTISGHGLSGSFAYAYTPADGLRFYLYAAHLSYYIGVTMAASQGADATAIALGRSPWDGGHYTNIGQPGSSLLAILRTYDLYRLD